MRDDLMQGKMMCTIWANKDAYIRMNCFDEAGSDVHTVFEGVIRGGYVTPIFYSKALPYNHLRIYVPAEENTAHGFDLTGFYATAVV